MSSLSDFKIGRLLGKGSFGVVILVQRIIDGQIYAMKQVRINQLPEKEKKNSLNEIRILASLSHKNIIAYKDAFFDENSKTLNIVMEYADNGDMSQKIKYNLKNGLIFSENIIWNYLIQILEGLHYLHEHNIIHRDLKSANIFLTQEGIVKIGDLNVSKIAKIGMAYTQTGTPYYASPEIWLDKPYDYKSDVWSLGCILYELCQLKPPFRGTSLKNLYYNIQRGIYEPIMNYYSEDLRNIIDIMLRTDPNMRPNTGQILKSKIIINKKMELKIGEDLDSFNETEKFGQKKLIDTIKIPKNMKEINGNLPSNKYNKRIKKKIREEMMKEDAYETNKKLNGFLNEEDKNEIKKIYGNNNIIINKIDVNNLEKNDIYKNNYNDNQNNNINYLIMNLKNNNNNLNSNLYHLNNLNSENNRFDYIIKDKQKLNKNISNNRIYYNNELKELRNKLNNMNNKYDLISLKNELKENRKKIKNKKVIRNYLTDVEDNNNYIYPKNKYKNNPKSEKVDDYISQNINIYNNINKYYYKNNFDLLTDNENIISKKPKEDNLNINYNKKQFSNNDIITNRINSDKSPSKFNYIFNNGKKFNNIYPENKLNNSINNDTKESNNFKLLMNNNFNPNININIYNNKNDKKPNLNNVDYIDNFDIDISSKKENYDIKPLEINSLESSYKNEDDKEKIYLLNDISDNNDYIHPNKNKKRIIQKFKTENNEYINNKNIKKNLNNILKNSDNESLNSQIFKLNQNKINYKNQNIQYNNRNKNINNKGKLIPCKKPKIKNQKNHRNKNIKYDNQISAIEEINDNHRNLLLSKKNNNNNYIQNNNVHNFKKPKLLLNLESYHPQLYI